MTVLAAERRAVPPFTRLRYSSVRCDCMTPNVDSSVSHAPRPNYPGIYQQHTPGESTMIQLSISIKEKDASNESSREGLARPDAAITNEGTPGRLHHHSAVFVHLRSRAERYRSSFTIHCSGSGCTSDYHLGRYKRPDRQHGIPGPIRSPE